MNYSGIIFAICIFIILLCYIFFLSYSVKEDKEKNKKDNIYRIEDVIEIESKDRDIYYRVCLRDTSLRLYVVTLYSVHNELESGEDWCGGTFEVLRNIKPYLVLEYDDSSCKITKSTLINQINEYYKSEVIDLKYNK